MTHNQIDYASLKEAQRHNRAMEQETARNNQAVLSETNRHNIVTEGQSKEQIDNQARYWDTSNEINATHLTTMDAEQHRHNVATEYIQAETVAENIRHNIASENENVRHNQEIERVGAINASAATVQASAARENAQAATKNAQTQALKQVAEHDLVRSEIELNLHKQQDLMSQQWHRNINTGLNAVDTFAEAFRDVGTGLEKFMAPINKVGNIIANFVK